MPRSKTKIEHNTFVKGLNTEAGPLTFPDNASLVDTNFVLNKDGSRQRRLGLTYEPDYTNKTITSIEDTTTAIKSYTWKSVNNKGTLDVAVIQVGNKLYFYDNNVTPITGSPLNGGSAVTVTAPTDIKYEFTESYGKLIVANGSDEVLALTYDVTLDTINTDYYRLTVRDRFGVQEVPDLDLDERPITLSNYHYYNLRNQGWPKLTDCIHSDVNGEFGSYLDPIVNTFDTIGVYPSNADTLAMGRTSSTVRVHTVGNYSPYQLKKEHGGTRQSPQGYHIIDVFNRGTSRALAMTGLPVDQTTGTINAVTSYAGRVFYAVKETSTSGTDDRSPSIGTMIFFSQSTDNLSDFGSCYAKNDPSAEDFNDPLATDGGFITIPDAGEIYSLSTLGESLFVITSRGVWEISGGENYFSATNQSITKIADFGAYSATSIVTGETSISFWSSGGIYIIGIGEVSLKGEVTNITQNVIQSLYDDIDFVSKSNAVGTYDDISKQIRWLYKEGALPNNYYYNRELVFDISLQSFYVNEIQELTMTSGSSPYVIGYVDLSFSVFTDETEDVEVGTGNTVQVVGVDVQSSTRLADQTTKGSTKFWSVRDLGTGNANLTVSGFYDLDFTDWSDETDYLGASGADAGSELITGYSTDGDAELDKKSKYITVYMKRTETGFTDDGGGNLTPIGESSCNLQGQWEWTDSAAAGRWSNEQEVYRLPRNYVPTGSGDPFDYSFTVVKTKNKIRGKGSALSLKFSSSPGKDLHIYGWSREITVPAQ